MLWTTALSLLLAWAMDRPRSDATRLLLLDGAVGPDACSFLFQLPDGGRLVVLFQPGAPAWRLFTEDAPDRVQTHIGRAVHGPDLGVPAVLLEEAKAAALQELHRSLVRLDTAVPLVDNPLEHARMRALARAGHPPVVPGALPVVVMGAPVWVSTLQQARQRAFLANAALGPVEGLLSPDVHALPPRDPPIPVLELLVGPHAKRVYIDAAGHLYQPEPSWQR